jgi:L-histidine Nalpha-methyltransferase
VCVLASYATIALAGSPTSRRIKPPLTDDDRADIKMPRFRLDQHLPQDFLINALRAEARDGLTASPKYISSKWLYDARGSQLYEQITQQPEYYPFRVERGILEAVADEIAAATRASSIIEFGSGSSDKTDILLRALQRAETLRAYTPIDISESALVAAGSRLIAEYPGLSVRAVLADFETQAEVLAADESPAPGLVLFLGGSIGQLSPDQRAEFLRKLCGSLRQGDMLLLGVDLVKDPAKLMAAYNDSAGVSATFSKNILSVLNAGVGADFNLDAFDYIVTWHSEVEHVAMWLQSRISQVVHLSDIGLPVVLAAGERIRMSISAKFRRAGIQAELKSAGFSPCHWWTDPHGEYALSLSRLM